MWAITTRGTASTAAISAARGPVEVGAALVLGFQPGCAGEQHGDVYHREALCDLTGRLQRRVVTADGTPSAVCRTAG